MRTLLLSLTVMAAAGCGGSEASESAFPDVFLNGLPTPRAYHGAVVVEDAVILVGGSSAKTPIATVDVFEGGAWRHAADLPTPRDFAGVATLDGHVYVVGGLTEGQSATAAFERLNVAMDQWETLPPLDSIRHRLAAASLDGRVYAIAGFEIGGDDEGQNSARVDAYDPATSTWSRVADMAIPRHGHAAAVLDGKLYVMGGYGEVDGDYGKLNSVEIYDPEADTWSAGPDMLYERGFLAATTHDGEVWAIGGRIQKMPLESLRPGGAWVDRFRVSKPRQRFALVAYHGCLVALGSENDPSDVSLFDPAANRWRRGTAGR
jgi:hypothetical protein